MDEKARAQLRLIREVQRVLAKEQYATVRNGGPLRDKDIRDIAVLRELAKTVR